ncbi:uncharacterized protein (DUF2336 family) [Litorimonas taeanensis]|uniref:Uncharacterized protein (DUF2336 family) n=1 Tax=Litorimonas taeanensis TaxID=568099 RepID=A0A420WKQ4_9PROT|nr:DUF2336 domain-containing protein [Litorimonas taeanensis]RKQ71584.1 uncharacterized protein (DUF2336 family) [Litorimonas taeanensis]
MNDSCPKISGKDAKIALRDADPEKRAYATMRLAQDINQADLSAADRAYANRLLDVISKDVSELVRRALAVTLKNSTFLPRAVLSRLITDIESIAVPLIEHSPILTDNDLRLVLKSGLAGKVRAVAARQNLSNKIILTLINAGDAVAVRHIAANDTVLLSEDAAQAMVEMYNEDDIIRAALMRRAALPFSVVEKLVSTSSDHIAERLETGYALSVEHSQAIGDQTYDRTMASLPTEHFSEKNLKDFIVSMHTQGRLRPEIIMRAMGLGQIALVHYGLATLAGLSVRKVVLMLHDTGPFALRGVCSRAGFDTEQTTFMQSAINIYTDLERLGEKLTEAEFQCRMIERILTLPNGFDVRETDYFLNILDGLSDEGY